MTSISSIILNLSAVNSAVTVYAKQNDRIARKITATLFDGSTAWTPPAGAAVVIRYRKPDGTVGFYDTDENGDPASSVSGNVVTLTIAEQALTVPGDVWMELNFYNSGDEKLTTFYFLLKVQQSVLDDGTIISSDYFNALTALYSQISAIAADLPVPSTATPLMDGTATAGDSADFSRGNHRHPSDASRLALAGNQYNVNPVDDLNNYATGFALFNNASGSPVANFPYDSSVTPWALVISGKADSGTVAQVAFNLLGGTPPRVRNCASGTWSAWADLSSSATALTGAVPVASGGTGATTAAAARNNLGVRQYIIHAVSSDDRTLAAGTSESFNISGEYTGYIPMAVVSFGAVNATNSGANANWIMTSACYLNSAGNVYWVSRNLSTAEAKYKATAYILYRTDE